MKTLLLLIFAAKAQADGLPNTLTGKAYFDRSCFPKCTATITPTISPSASPTKGPTPKPTATPVQGVK